MFKYVSRFNKEYNEKVKGEDQREKLQRIGLLLEEVAHKPNHLQMAIAQTAVALLNKYHHQVHVISGG